MTRNNLRMPATAIFVMGCAVLICSCRDAEQKPVDQAPAARSVQDRYDVSEAKVVAMRPPSSETLKAPVSKSAASSPDRDTSPSAARSRGSVNAVSGHVTDSDGKPIAGAKVTATTRGDEPREAFSDAKGLYRLDGFTVTSATLTAVAPHYFAATKQDIDVSRTDVNFVLRGRQECRSLAGW